MRCRRQIRAVGFDEAAVQRHHFRATSRRSAAFLKVRIPGERDHENPSPMRRACHFLGFGEAVENAPDLALPFLLEDGDRVGAGFAGMDDQRQTRFRARRGCARENARAARPCLPMLRAFQDGSNRALSRRCRRRAAAWLRLQQVTQTVGSWMPSLSGWTPTVAQKFVVAAMARACTAREFFERGADAQGAVDMVGLPCRRGIWSSVSCVFAGS